MSRLSHGERRLRDDMWRKGLVWCKDCEQFLPARKFVKYSRSRSNYGYRYYCRKCEYKRRDKKRLYRYSKRRNDQLKIEFVELAGGCCQRCGFDEAPAALDFHHVYSAKKQGEPSRLIFSRDKTKAWGELDKCCLLCSNCHRLYKARVWRAEFIKRDGLGWTVGKSLPLDDGRYEKKPEEYVQARLPDTYLTPAVEQLSFL